MSWGDSVLATLSLRDKAAQLVWPLVFGDYASTSSASWARSETYVTNEHVGGLIMSVGSPIEIAEKLNAMQRLSSVPLLVGADLETGAGFRARGGYFLPNAIDLGGATDLPASDGHRRDARHVARVRAGSNHGARRTRSWHPHRVRARCSTSTTIQRIRSSASVPSARIRGSSARSAQRSYAAFRSTA